MPKHSVLSHGINSVVVALNVLNDLGLPRALCLRRTGITEAALADPHAVVQLSQELAFYRNVLNVSGDPLIGLRIGAGYHLANYGMWGFAMMSTSSFRQALAIALRFVPLTFTFFDYSIEEKAGEVTMAIDPLGDYGNCNQLLIDREIAAAYAVLCQVLDIRFPLNSVHVVHNSSRYSRRYRDHYGCDVTFGSDRSRFAFPRALLDLTPRGNNPNTAEFCTQQCELLVARLDSASTLVHEIRQRLMFRPGQFRTLDQLATEMGMSSRSLRRHLANETTSYRSILDGVRFELAKEYLDETSLPLSDIAAVLGYNEPANFSHAFKRWSGKTPSAYRNGR